MWIPNRFVYYAVRSACQAAGAAAAYEAVSRVANARAVKEGINRVARGVADATSDDTPAGEEDNDDSID
ncbi:MAG: hypothetical protein OXI96_09870 [Acidimicrobiaceae bacterium]|nr:hypothetical protein [Acidimicrobiaceae bacterium]